MLGQPSLFLLSLSLFLHGNPQSLVDSRISLIFKQRHRNFCLNSLTIANSGSSVGSIPNSNPCPMGARGAPSSPARMGDERRTSESKGPGCAVTKWLVWSLPFKVSINLASLSVFSSYGINGICLQLQNIMIQSLMLALHQNWCNPKVNSIVKKTPMT